MSETRELNDPRREVEGGRVEWLDGHYKIKADMEVRDDGTVEDLREQAHDRLCECFDCIPPLTPLEKMQHPFKRRYPTENSMKKLTSNNAQKITSG